jgi:HEAT repeat protein
VRRRRTVDNTAVVREAAARALVAIAPADPAAAPAYAFVLRYGRGDERLEAVTSLARLGADAAAAVPDLLAALDGEDDEARRHAVVALGGIGPTAQAALPRLRELARSEDAGIAARSAAAIRSIERDRHP